MTSSNGKTLTATLATQDATPAQLPEVAVDVLDGAVAGADVVVGAVVVTDVEDVEDADVVVGADVGTVTGDEVVPPLPLSRMPFLITWSARPFAVSWGASAIRATEGGG